MVESLCMSGAVGKASDALGHQNIGLAAAVCIGEDACDAVAVLQIEFSWASNIKSENRFVELRGTKAGLKWKENEVEFFTEEDGQLLDIAPSNINEKHGHMYNLSHFYDVVIDGAKPIFEPQQGIDMIKILCAIYESAKTGKEVSLA